MKKRNMIGNQQYEYNLKCKRREKYELELSDLNGLVVHLEKKKLEPRHFTLERIRFLKKKIARMM